MKDVLLVYQNVARQEAVKTVLCSPGLEAAHLENDRWPKVQTATCFAECGWADVLALRLQLSRWHFVPNAEYEAETYAPSFGRRGQSRRSAPQSRGAIL